MIIILFFTMRNWIQLIHLSFSRPAYLGILTWWNLKELVELTNLTVSPLLALSFYLSLCYLLGESFGESRSLTSQYDISKSLYNPVLLFGVMQVYLDQGRRPSIQKGQKRSVPGLRSSDLSEKRERKLSPGESRL